MEKSLHITYDSKSVSLHYPSKNDALLYCFEPAEVEYVLSNFFNEHPAIISVEYETGMTDVICYIDFKYHTSDNEIESICVKALDLIKDFDNHYNDDLIEKVEIFKFEKLRNNDYYF